MLRQTAFILAALAAIARAAPAAPNAPVCGLPDQASCPNLDIAKYYVEYIDWNGVFTWSECRNACQSDPLCKSFQYYFTIDSGLNQTSFTCEHYNHSISEYTRPCAFGAQNLATYWDSDCHDLEAKTDGDVPDTPSTNLTDGTCNSGRVPQVPLLFADQIVHKIDLDQRECQQLCMATDTCKSYLWQNFNSPAVRYANGSQGATGGTPFECLLLTQPVAEYTYATGSVFSGDFYDINCPVSNHSVIRK